MQRDSSSLMGAPVRRCLGRSLVLGSLVAMTTSASWAQATTGTPVQTVPTMVQKPINLTQVVGNLLNGTATIDGVISMVGTNHFTVMRANNRFTLIFLQPGQVLPIQLYPGGHIVVTVAPDPYNNFYLTAINQYDGIDPTQPGITPVTPPLPTSPMPTLPIINTPIPIPQP